MWKLSSPMSQSDLMMLISSQDCFNTVNIVNDDGEQKKVRLSSVQREDGSGKSFNLTFQNKDSGPIETYKVYLRCTDH